MACHCKELHLKVEGNNNECQEFWGGECVIVLSFCHTFVKDNRFLFDHMTYFTRSRDSCARKVVKKPGKSCSDL
jgi:hypothetical protein